MTHSDFVERIRVNFDSSDNTMVLGDVQYWRERKGSYPRKTICEIINVKGNLREIIRISSRFAETNEIVSDLRMDILTIMFPSKNIEIETFESKYDIIYDNSADMSKEPVNIEFVLSILNNRDSFLRRRYIE